MRIQELIAEAGGVGKIVKGVNTTPDVQPGEIKRQAAKFGMTVDDESRPPIANPDGTVGESFEEIAETWSKKYKRSIDCSHPRGFSQKAHCAARRKRQAGGKTKSRSVSEVQQIPSNVLETLDMLMEQHGLSNETAVGVVLESLDESLRDWFKEKWVRFGPDGKIRGACARGKSSEGKPKCLPQAKAHALGKKARAKAARRKRREDPNPERKGKAHNVATKESVKLLDKPTMTVAELAKKYHVTDDVVTAELKKGMKVELEHTSKQDVAREIALDHIGEDLYYYKKLAKVEKVSEEHRQSLMYENAVADLAKKLKKHQEELQNCGKDTRYDKIDAIMQSIAKANGITANTLHKDWMQVHHQLPDNWVLSVSESFGSCPHCGGQLVSEAELQEKQDACYYKVRRRYKVWPSAYASGALVQCRKKGAKNWGKAEEAVTMPLQETVDEQQQIHVVAEACAKWAQRKVKMGIPRLAIAHAEMKDIVKSAGIWSKLSGLLQTVLDPQDRSALELEVDYEQTEHDIAYLPASHGIHVAYKPASKDGLAKAIAHELQHAVDEIKSQGMVFITHPGVAQTPEDKARYWRHHSEVNARLTEALLDLSKLKISRERFPKVLAGLLHEYALAPHGKYALDPSVYRRLLSRGYVFYTQSQQQQQTPTPNLWQRMKQLASAAANAILGQHQPQCSE